MSILKTSYYTACSLLPMAFVKSIGPSTTLFPYHHTVSNEFLPHIKHLYNYKNEKQFAADLDFLLKHYRPVTSQDILKSIQDHNRLPARSFYLSFDDGFREVFYTIAPILEKKGVPACFFINPDFIDNTVLFYRCKISLMIHELVNSKDQHSFLKIIHEVAGIEQGTVHDAISFLKTVNTKNSFLLDKIAERIGYSYNSFLTSQTPFLSFEQVKALHKKGFEIGAHSMNHPYFQLIPLQEQIEQVAGSVGYVNELLAINNCSFSFPHSDRGISQELFREISGLNIPLLFGIQNQKMELENKMLHRFNAERPEVNFPSLVKGMSLMMGLRNLAGRNKINRN